MNPTPHLLTMDKSYKVELDTDLICYAWLRAESHRGLKQKAPPTETNHRNYEDPSWLKQDAHYKRRIRLQGDAQYIRDEAVAKWTWLLSITWPISLCELVLTSEGGRHQQPQYYSRCWNERERKHMCFYWFFSESAREKNWLSTEGWSIHLTASHSPRREDSNQFWASSERPIYEVLLRGRRYFARAAPSRFRHKTSSSSIVCTAGLPRLYQGRRWCCYIWDAPWRRIWLHKCYRETNRYSYHNTWNRPCQTTWFVYWQYCVA